ncbi:tetratricopeptide repeat protein [bacterium]|nr:tetratricopeptide repeat protein [bacterium]
MMSRRAKLEAMLAQSPGDTFLGYGLAMEMIKEGDTEAGKKQLVQVIEANPDYQAAYFQLGQILTNEGEIDEAKGWLERGIVAAKRIGDAHAAAEMEGFLLTL